MLSMSSKMSLEGDEVCDVLFQTSVDCDEVYVGVVLMGSVLECINDDERHKESSSIVRMSPTRPNAWAWQVISSMGTLSSVPEWIMS